METLDLNNKRKREKLTASEWNSLIDAINLLILRYNLEATIPTKLSQLTNDAGFITDISGKADKSDLARVATTGSYNDLKDKPDLSNIGSAGKSAYELAVENGYQGTIQLWLLSLKGQDGTNGTNGSDGITPHIDSTTGNWFIGETNTGVSAQGPLGIQGETGALGSQGILGIQGPQGPTGTDGITPTVSITNITGGHNVAFSYGTGDSRNIDFDVMDGTSLSNENASSGGNTLSAVTTGEKYTWNLKANIWSGTQAQYDAITTPDANTIYIITSAS